MKPPAIASAEQTMPPTTNAVMMPVPPCKPTADRIKELRIKVIMVMPDTGFVPTVAMAVAATVVNRKANKNTTRMPTIICVRFICMPPKMKKSTIMMITAKKPKSIIFMGISRWVRSTCCSSPLLPLLALKATLSEVLITPADLITPKIPAMAIPPMPMYLTYCEKIKSGSIVLINTPSGVTPYCPNRGTINHHDRKEPAQIIIAYFKPIR